MQKISYSSLLKAKKPGATRHCQSTAVVISVDSVMSNSHIFLTDTLRKKKKGVFAQPRLVTYGNGFCGQRGTLGFCKGGCK